LTLVISYFGLYAQAWVEKYVELIFLASESDVFTSTTKASRLKKKARMLFTVCLFKITAF
jgi:hypothetical protein